MLNSRSGFGLGLQLFFQRGICLSVDLSERLGFRSGLSLGFELVLSLLYGRGVRFRSFFEFSFRRRNRPGSFGLDLSSLVPLSGEPLFNFRSCPGLLACLLLRLKSRRNFGFDFRLSASLLLGQDLSLLPGLGDRFIAGL